MISRLRWHLHELDPGNEPAARALNQLRNLDQLADASRRRRGDGRPARTRARRALPRSSTVEINELEREITALVAAARAVAARDLRLRAADRRQDPRRDRRHRTLQEQGRLRPPQRHRAAAGLVIEPGPPPTQPHRQPAAQRRDPPHRAHPGPPPPRRAEPCSPADAPTATAASKPSASSNAASPTSSTAPSKPTPQPTPPRRRHLTEEQGTDPQTAPTDVERRGPDRSSE